MQVSQELAETHYAIHKGKPFYEPLIRYITSAPVMAMVWEGPNAVAAVRQTMGSTRPIEAAPGTLRHDFALEVGRNLTHASDLPENGVKEVELWFTPEELVSLGPRRGSLDFRVKRQERISCHRCNALALHLSQLFPVEYHMLYW